MRHQKKTLKLGRSTAHRDALLANQVCSLIEHTRITTTLAKAKAVRPLAEKLVTLGKKGTLHARRVALSYLHHNEAAVRKLFGEIATRTADRKGGYVRIIKKGPRKSDSAPMAIMEWVDQAAPVAAEPAKVPEAKETAAPAEAKTEVKAEKAKA